MGGMAQRETEVDLCKRLIDAADGWTAYPEVGRWDIVLERDGITVGVQAKLQCSWQLLDQVTRSRRREIPNHRTILIPKFNKRFMRFARRLGVGTYTASGLATMAGFKPRGPYQESDIWLPDVPSPTPAGSPSPSSLTPWRQAAIRLCILLDRQGFLSGADFASHGVNPQRWVTRGWLVKDGWWAAEGRRWRRYTRGPAETMPDTGWDVIRDQLTPA
jgi:hypothetical protein